MYRFSSIEPTIGGFLIERRIKELNMLAPISLPYVRLDNKQKGTQLLFVPSDRITVKVREDTVVYHSMKAELEAKLLPNLTVHLDNKKTLSRIKRVIRTLIRSDEIRYVFSRYSKLDIYVIQRPDIRLYLSTVYLNKSNNLQARIYLSSDQMPAPVFEAVLIHEFAHVIYEYYKSQHSTLKDMNLFLPLKYRLSLILERLPDIDQRRECLKRLKEGYYFNRSFPTFGHPHTSESELFASSFTILYLLTYEKESLSNLEDENARNMEREVRTMIEDEASIWSLLYYIAYNLNIPPDSKNIISILNTPRNR